MDFSIFSTKVCEKKIKKPYLMSLIIFEQTTLAHELFCDITSNKYLPYFIS